VTAERCEMPGCDHRAVWRVENKDPMNWRLFVLRCGRHAPPPAERTKWNCVRVEGAVAHG
jgi:hypothetical protein